jgi:hypothetical protein
MSTYIRFQTSVLCSRTQRPLGVFRAAGEIADRELVDEHLGETLEDILHWFNRNLRVPRITREHAECLFWFRADQQQVVSRLWDLVAILAEHHVHVRKIRTNDPGLIVYRDEFQVAAMPSRRVTKSLSETV